MCNRFLKISHFALILSCSLCIGCATGHGDYWFGRDKLYHFGAAGLIGGAAAMAGEDHDFSESEKLQISVGATFAIGAGKEMYDKHIKKTFWSWKDIVWDLLGGLAGYGVVRVCE